MINTSNGIFSEFNIHSTKSSLQESTKQSESKNKTSKYNKIKSVTLLAIPTAVGAKISNIVNSIHYKNAQDIFVKENKELKKELATSFRNNDVVSACQNYIKVLKDKLIQNTKDIEKAKEILKNLTIPCEREELGNILETLASDRIQYTLELEKYSKEHRAYYDELITKPLNKFSDKHLKKLASTKKIIYITGILSGILIGGIALFLNERRNKDDK